MLEIQYFCSLSQLSERDNQIMIQQDVKIKQYLKVTFLGMCLGCIPNMGIYVVAGMHKNYLKTKVFMQRNRFLSKDRRIFYVALILNLISTTLVRPGIQIQVGDTPSLQLASFEEIFTQGMRLEMQMQNSTAKQSFCIILMVGIYNYIYKNVCKSVFLSFVLELCRSFLLSLFLSE